MCAGFRGIANRNAYNLRTFITFENYSIHKSALMKNHISRLAAALFFFRHNTILFFQVSANDNKRLLPAIVYTG